MTPARSERLRLREEIRERARAIGFEQVGFAPADPPAHADAFLEWLRRGWHGEMTYMAREDTVRRRLDLEETLPDCRTVVVVSLRYAGIGPRDDEGAARRQAEGTSTGRDGSPLRRDGSPARGPPDPLEAIVAGYATGPDYHGVFEDLLSELAEFVEGRAPGARTRPYVDYGPVLERDHAQRAGLGWIGKNTMLIDPELGSYLLLGELLTTLELPPDEAFTADRCGTCARCIQACPTDAIRGPRELDARRCISYLTIELRGPIPEELRPLIGNRVFGCDICQEVCPWNGDVPPVDESPLVEKSPLSMIRWADELVEATAAEYRARYRGTAFSRPGRDGMLRNLCVGLGNSGEPAALPVLRRAVEDRSELVREHARWALERLEGGAGS